MCEELDVAAAGVAEDHREAVEAVACAILVEGPEGAEVYLRLDARSRLEADDGSEGAVSLQGSDEILDDGVPTEVSPFADFLEEADGAQVVLGQASLQIVLEGINGARARCSRGARPGRSLQEKGVDGVAVNADHASDVADG